MATLLALETEFYIALFENSASGQYQLKHYRTHYSNIFKGKRQKIKTFEHFDPEHITLNKLYEKYEFDSALTAYKNKLELEKKSDKRKPHPMAGDYLQLMQHGRLSEDFTFVKELVADHDEGEYVVIDIYEHEYLVSANPDRDNGRRRAFKQIK